MVTDFLLNLFGDLFFFILDVVPDPGFPNWMVGEGEGTIAGSLDWVAANMGPMAGWINFPLMSSAVALLVAAELVERLFLTLARVIALVRGGGF